MSLAIPELLTFANFASGPWALVMNAVGEDENEDGGLSLSSLNPF